LEAVKNYKFLAAFLLVSIDQLFAKIGVGFLYLFGDY
jgi:hypothetical protein